LSLLVKSVYANQVFYALFSAAGNMIADGQIAIIGRAAESIARPKACYSTLAFYGTEYIY